MSCYVYSIRCIPRDHGIVRCKKQYALFDNKTSSSTRIAHGIGLFWSVRGRDKQCVNEQRRLRWWNSKDISVETRAE